MLFTDRRTVFEYKQKKSPSVEEDTFTQFSYACNQLGIEIRTSFLNIIYNRNGNRLMS